MAKTIKGQQLTRRTWVAGGVAAAVSALLPGCGGGGGIGLEEPADALMPMGSGPGSAGFTSNHNYGQELSGGTAIARQVLDLYRGNIPAGTRCPVYIYAHSNGTGVTYRTQLPSDNLRLELIRNGIAVISWESHQNLSVSPNGSVPGDGSIQDEMMNDAALMLRWVIEKGPALGLDPDRIVLGGSSRGTHASWLIGHDPANASRIKGMFMKQALPGSVEATKCQNPNPYTVYGKTPPEWVTAGSPRIQFVHHPANLNGGCTPTNDLFHSELNSRPVMDAYAGKLIGSRASRILNATSVGAMDDYLVPFVTSCLSASPPPPPPPNVIDFFDDFNSGFNATDYTRNGTWDVSGGVLRQMNNASYGYCAAGESGWVDYTVTAAIMSLNSLSATDNAQVSRVVARFTDGNNFYEAFVTKNGLLTLQSKKAGTVRTIQSVQVSGINVGAWNTLALACSGNLLTVSLNGVAQATVSATDHSAGKAGVRSFACETRVDSLSIVGP